jgi:hypothetical protein
MFTGNKQLKKLRKKPYSRKGLKRKICSTCGSRANTQVQFDGVYYPLCDDCKHRYNLIVTGFLKLYPNIILTGDVTIEETLEVSMKRGELSALPPLRTLK